MVGSRRSVAHDASRPEDGPPRQDPTARNICNGRVWRVESKTKTKADLSMSHSTESSRTWDFGMVDTDLIAFPVCIPAKEAYWSRGKLGDEASYWHEKNWIDWRLQGVTNYFS